MDCDGLSTNEKALKIRAFKTKMELFVYQFGGAGGI